MMMKATRMRPRIVPVSEAARAMPRCPRRDTRPSHAAIVDPCIKSAVPLPARAYTGAVKRWLRGAARFPSRGQRVLNLLSLASGQVLNLVGLQRLRAPPRRGGRGNVKRLRRSFRRRIALAALVTGLAALGGVAWADLETPGYHV